MKKIWKGIPNEDVHSALRFAARWLCPLDSYLEIGVDGGGSLLAVVENVPHPLKHIVLCDLWQWERHPHFRSHAHIEEMLKERNVDMTTVDFLDGDSKVMIPSLPLMFDLITVDGDHSAEGALADLNNTWPLLRQGGILVMDDVGHVSYPHLTQVFINWYAALNARIIPQDGTCSAVVVEKL